LEAATRRREFIGAIGSAAFWSVTASAQGVEKIPAIGILWEGASAEKVARVRLPFLKGLAELGYIPGKSILLEERFSNGMVERLDALATELVSLKVDVLVTAPGAAVLAVKRATSTAPVVFVAISDPIAFQLVSSLARPGGNMTGLSNLGIDSAAKRIQLIKDLGISRVALLYDPNVPVAVSRDIPDFRAAADKFGMPADIFQARSAGDLEQSFSEMAKLDFKAVILANGTMFYGQIKLISELGLKNRLAVIAPSLLFVDDGCLLSYGADIPGLYHDAARYVHRILRGEKPGDIPIEQPTKFELGFNLKTAKALGIDVPPIMLTFADKVIE
jgi:putative tryptophan/tyrosine transport system substrate-binding protein